MQFNPLALSKKTISIFRVRGIPVRIDYRWFVIFVLSVWLVAANLETGDMWVGNKRLGFIGGPMAWTLGAVTTLALFLSVLGHELSHALVARGEGIEIEEIVLHPFGGLARLKNEPKTPKAEFRIAIAGPAASFLFSLAAFAGMLLAAKGECWKTASVFLLVGSGNLLLALFNLLPGYPLDGGRILRALLWHRGNDIAEATRITGYFGQLVAWTLVGFGLYIAVAWQAYFMGFWSVLVGLFLRGAAASIVNHVRRGDASTVQAVMGPAFEIEPDLLLSNFVDAILPLYPRTSFPVAHGKLLYGILTLQDLRAVPRNEWPYKRVREVMRPVEPSFFVDPSTTMSKARLLMQRNGTGSVAVLGTKGEVVGFLEMPASRNSALGP